MDYYFCDFVDFIWRKYKGKRRQLCVNAKHGILLELGFRFKHRFSQSDRCLIAWKRNQPVLSALPIPQRWLDVFAWLILRKGHGLLGLGLLVAFAGCLRASELLGLHGSDILLPGDSRDSSNTCGLRLRRTKTGRNQFARISDPAVITVLSFLKCITPANSRIFKGLSGLTFNNMLKWVCNTVGLSFYFTMHSLRHGAATHKFLGGEAPETIRLEGRWASGSSMETYLQACASLLISLSCPPSLVDLFAFGPQLRTRILSAF